MGVMGRGVGVLVSGGGTNLQALIDDGIPIAAVATNVTAAPALERARRIGAPLVRHMDLMRPIVVVGAIVVHQDHFAGQLHDARDRADRGVVVDREAELPGVEGLRPVDVGDRHADHFEGPVHQGILPDRRGAGATGAVPGTMDA